MPVRCGPGRCRFFDTASPQKTNRATVVLQPPPPNQVHCAHQGCKQLAL
ncbi:hypothetical protein CCHOA_11555 [Corynebacterium choanae]|uniref:Uncharacterized protein n=1 Tax=Corynebacterium choanae TaxID=1862358 RepID=A0A3G6JA46_9CORY|nr:hypothetical protein CCHOA_11555 [Corynebacterium choanae]